MNAKKVKRLRRSIGYHPRDRREYEFDDEGTMRLIHCSRVQYLEKKRGAK